MSKKKTSAAVAQKEEREPWKEPEWMKKYTEHLTNTGGWITPEHAINCRGPKDGCDSFSNSIRAALCVAVQSQVQFLLRLKNAGLIK